MALPTFSALVTCKALMYRIILRHGPPRAIITDRGSNFTSALFTALCKALNVKHMKTTAYHPQTNRQTESCNKTVTENIKVENREIRKYIENGFEKWEDILGPVAFAYNNSTHSSTSKTPYFLNHGRDPVMPIDQFLLPLPSAIVTPSDYKSQIMRRLHEAFQLVKINLAQAREQQKIQYDKRVKIAEFHVGDKVLLDMRTPIIGVSKKLIPHFVGPYRILKMCNNSTVEIQQCASKQTQLVHINRIKLLYESMIWKDEPGVDFLDTRVNREADQIFNDNLAIPVSCDEIEPQPQHISESETVPSMEEARRIDSSPTSVNTCPPNTPNFINSPSTIPSLP
jgi:hypothetical protein